MSKTFLPGRRDFLRHALAAAAGCGRMGAALGMLGGAGVAAAQTAPSDYRALVCVYLTGGNDGWNTLVPTQPDRYDAYAAARRSLALPKESLLDLGNGHGLHPSADALQRLFAEGKLAPVANVGTLLAPITKSQAQAGQNLPAQLYSHNDQTLQVCSGQPDAPKPRGWGGLIGDLMASWNGTPDLSLNISMRGQNLFQTGQYTVPYTLSPKGIELLKAASGDAIAARRWQLMQNSISQAISRNDLVMEPEHAAVTRRAHDLSMILSSALDTAPSSATRWPDTQLASQLSMVARMISVRDMLSMRRQVFFVNIDGFDTHDDQLNKQAENLSEISGALEAFQRELEALGVGSDVTTFTMTDFGRTLTPNNDGSDHGWGNVNLVMGAAVAGGRIYGSYPDLTLNGPDDIGAGRILPTTANEQFAATLARWFGVGESDLDLMFPHLSRFDSRDLGFMSA